MVISYSLSFTLALLLLHVPIILAAIGPVTNLSVVNAAIAPDGFQRSAVLANGVFPGPLITGKKGDNFKINVSDLLTDDTMEKTTSVHWHGMSATNYNDGAGFVTQCPIIPNNSYEYDWTVPYQAGTFWYHSHISTQYCDGLRGPLVIYDPQDPHAHLYDHDDDSTVITLADWYHLPFAKIPRPAVPDSILINGLGRFAGGPSSPLAVINVEPSKRYRFRLISMSCAPFFTFSIDGHNLTVIESDGINTSPLVVDSIQIFAGQRYSFVLEAKANVGNYWIRAHPDSSYTGDPHSSSGGINSAILRYTGAAEVDPTTKQANSTMPLSETNLHPLENPGAPGMHGAADITINLDLDFDGTKKQFLVNGISFTPPSVPVLLQILSGSMQASNLLPNGSVFTLPRNKVVEISIPPGGAIEGPHPFHLHGHPFDVIRTAGNSSYNYDNPVRRDVTSIGDPGDNVTIRFFTNNPGPWLLHCHIETHLEMGLAIVFAEEPQDIASSNHVTSDWEQLCPKFNQFNSGARSVNAARRLSPIPFWLSTHVFQNAWSFVWRRASFGYS